VWYVVQANMKHFVAVLVIGWALPWAICKAEDGSIQNTKEYPASEKQAAPQREVKPATRSRQIASRPHYRHWHLTADWRVAYYAHAYARPWWPNAPGD